MKTILSIFFIVFSNLIFAQNVFKAIIKDNDSNEPLTGVNVFIPSLNVGAASDTFGKAVIKNIPNGTYHIKFSYIGYESKIKIIKFPNNYSSVPMKVMLEKKSLEIGQITVTSTRTDNRIKDVPLRVEVLGSDEVNEEIGIKPGNISKLLGETSGILVQQTSATTGNVTFRIQGLPGRYTQLLQDGFPLYSGLSSGLSLLQIPPLDLQQVEVIKGASSALYGGDAIAGVVNLVSKKPKRKSEWTVLLNATQKGEKDISSFYTRRKNKIGITFLANYSTQNAVDVNHNGFTDIPQFNQFDIFPKLFFYPDSTTFLMGGIDLSYDERQGGDIFAIENAPDSLHSYLNKNKSSHLVTQFVFRKKFGENKLTLKNSFSRFKRKITLSNNRFEGTQNSSYSELSYLFNTNRNKIVLGANFNTDNFNPNSVLTNRNLAYNYFTTGLFLTDNWHLSDKIIFQPSFRVDYHNKYHFFYLPQASILFNLLDDLSIRIGGGTGYKVPTIFTESAEEQGFKDVLPIANNIQPERSVGENFDISYQNTFWDFLNFSIDQSFYYTKVNHSLIPKSDSLSKGIIDYKNSFFPIEVKGFDTHMDLSEDEFEFFVDYTFNDAYVKYPGKKSYLDLTPRSKLNMTLTYEKENDWRTGIEAFYTGHEYLKNGLKSRPYWLIGVMVEKMFKHFDVIGNVENLFDVRQTKFENIVNPPLTKPTFKQLYAPIDGIVANIAVKINI